MFREELSKKIGIPIPADAFSAMDYHIDWLYASLKLAEYEEPKQIYPNDNHIIKAQQEDVDWLVAFESDGMYHLILIEAKGVTGWGNKQLNSKASRVSDIFGEQGNIWPGVKPYFVIISPSDPKRV